MLHHDHIVLFPALILLGITSEVRLLPPLLLSFLISFALWYRDAHCLELAVEESVAVRKLISFNVFTEQQVAIFVSSDISFPFG